MEAFLLLGYTWLITSLVLLALVLGIMIFVPCTENTCEEQEEFSLYITIRIYLIVTLSVAASYVLDKVIKLGWS